MEHFLQTNRYPNSGEVRQVQEAILVQHRIFGESAEETNASTTSFFNPPTLQSRAEETLSRDVEMLNPIGRVPVEILSSIFWEVVNDDLSWGHRVLTHPAFTLAQVSSFWRACAIAYASLWHHLSIRVHDDGLHVSSLMDMWMGRAGNGPVDLTFTLTSRLEKEFLVIALSKHLPKLRGFSLLAPIENLGPFLALSDHRLPMLESVHIEVVDVRRYGVPDEQPLMAPTLFTESPCLRRFSITSSTIPLDLTPLELPYHCIQHFCMNNPAFPPPGLYRGTRLTNLVHLTLTLRSWHHNTDPSPPVTLPNLRALSVRVISSRTFPQFASFFILPALTALKLEALTDFTWPHDDLTKLQQRSAFQLGCLTTIDVDLDDPHMTPFLARNPDLVFLSLQGKDILTPGLLDSLVWTSSSSTNVLPKLQSLVLKERLREPLDAGRVAKLVDSRWNGPEGVTNLQDLTLIHNDSQPTRELELFDWVAGCNARGQRISVWPWSQITVNRRKKT